MKIAKYFLGICCFGIVVVGSINLTIILSSKKYIYSDIQNIPKCYTGIVPGALVSQSGELSDFLQDRVDKAIELYRIHKIQRFLVSGDHGEINYDEVNSMKNYLLKHGVNTADIFMDHAGFDTYSSIIRAKEIFQVKDVVIISQKFHLPRAVYIARRKGLNAFGIVADKRVYASLNVLKKREILANIKAYIEILIHKKPKFLGDKIPITGDSSLSYD